jgi:tetratricopeptide (TPR) repeat protein
MDEDILQKILVEVQETNKFNRKMQRYFSIFVMVMVMLAIAAFLIHDGSITNNKDKFRTQARRLIHDNKPSEVIPLAEKYIKQEPLNPYGPWYLALAQYELGNYQDALHWLDKAQELAPTWENDYIKPYRTVIEKKLSKSTSRSEK